MSRTQVTFDGHDLTEYCVVSDLDNPLLPREVETVDVPGRDGSIYVGTKLSPRTIGMTLTVRGATDVARQEAARELASILAVSEPKPLDLGIDGGIYYMAMPVADDDGERYRNATRYAVEFRVPDPVGYGDEVTVTVPSGGSVTFEVGGTYPTKPLVSASAAANGSGGYWRLRLEDGSYLIATIPSGVSTAPVVADCHAPWLKVNGNVVMLDAYADWLVLTPGEHTIEMAGTGAATVKYRERWL